MTKMSIKPNNETYLIMITHYIDQGFVLKAENLLTECEKEMKLRDEDYLAVVYTFEKFGYEHKAKEVKFEVVSKSRNLFELLISDFFVVVFANRRRSKFQRRDAKPRESFRQGR